MSLELLERQQALVPEWDDREFNEEFVKQCETTLGYHHLTARRDQHDTDSWFCGILNELGIKPFTSASVEKYKADMLWKAHQPRRLWLYGVATVLFACICGLSASLCFNMPLLGIPFLIVGIISGIAVYTVSFDPPTSLAWEWSTLDIGAVANVPEFALQTALDVKRKVEGHHIYMRVNVLRNREQQARDPFLIVRFNGQDYYVEVWNEPGYKQQRQV